MFALYAPFMLEVAVSAAGGNHDLSGFAAVEGSAGDMEGYQAKCRRCGMTAWVSEDGLIYSLLADICPGTLPSVR
jgi:hypothetical protein